MNEWPEEKYRLLSFWQKFAETVIAMRDAQNHYFSTRSRDALVSAKRAEMAVDLLVKQITDGRLYE